MVEVCEWCGKPSSGREYVEHDGRRFSLCPSCRRQFARALTDEGRWMLNALVNRGQGEAITHA